MGDTARNPVLGLDPGLRHFGWCLLWREPARTPIVENVDGLACGYEDRALRFMAGTLRLEAAPDDDDAWLDEAIAQVDHLAAYHAPALVAVEDFTHRPWQRRTITHGVRMGKLVGTLCYHLRTALRLPVALVRAEETKRSMNVAKAWFPDSHTFSAYCAAVYGKGAAKHG